MRRRKQTETPSDLMHVQAAGANIHLGFYGQANGIRSLALRPVGDIHARIGSTVTFERA